MRSPSVNARVELERTAHVSDREAQETVEPQTLPESQSPPDLASLDSEIDFDDESDDDQAILDEAEAREAGVLLDDPDQLLRG